MKQRDTIGENIHHSSRTIHVPGNGHATVLVSEPRQGSGTAVRVCLLIFAGVAFLYFARPVLLPLALACVGGMILKPCVQWLKRCRIPPPLGAAVVLVVIGSGVLLGFVHLSRPAVQWVNEAPEHIVQVRQRLENLFRPATQLVEAAAAVTDLRKPDERKPTPVEVKNDQHANLLLNQTGTFLAGACETVVLLYLLLASGDAFSRKLAKVMPNSHDKRCAVEINHEIQQNISNYLFSITLINLGLGIILSAGLYLTGVPNPAMWGALAAALNFIPYFGPIAGIALLGFVGLLSFDTLPRELLPPAWYLALHLLEANFLTPVLMGRHFRLQPVVIFVSLMFWMWLWGVPGALLAVPILISLKAVCDRVPALSMAGEFLAG